MFLVTVCTPAQSADPSLNKNQMSMTFTHIVHFPKHSSYIGCILPADDVSLKTAHIPWTRNEGGRRTFHVG